MSGMNAPININLRVIGQSSIGSLISAFGALQRAVSALSAAATQSGRALAAVESSITSLDRTMKYILAGTVIALTGNFIKMMSDLERLGITMATVENSFDKANIALDRMLVLTQRVPFSLNTIHEAFVKIRATGITPIINDAGDGPLKNLLDAVAAFGGTDEQVKRVALAIEQMAGKGVVSMEELRRQMGQQIPTAIRLMAEGMGISVAKLISDIGKGAVAFNDAVPPMLDKFKEKYGGASDLMATTFSGAMRQATAEINKFAVTLTRAGALDVLTSGIMAAVRAMRSLNSAISVDTVKGWMNDLLNFADRNMDAFVRAVATIQDFGSAFATVIGALFGALSQLPAEAVAGGVIGFLIFGRVGLVAGAILGPATEVVMGVASAFAVLFTAILGIISSAGIETNAMMTYGLIGWLLFGRLGLLAGVLISFVDQIFGYIRAKVAEFVGAMAYLKGMFMSPLSPHAGGRQAMQEFYDTYTKNGMNPDAVEGFFGFGDTDKTPLQELFGRNPKAEADGVSSSISRISQTMSELRDSIGKTRAEFDGKFGQVDDIPGLSTNAQRGIENFGKALGSVQDRLEGAYGSPIDTWVNRQKRTADKFESEVIRPMEDAWRKFNEQGKFKEADSLMQSLGDAWDQLSTFRKNVDRVAELEKGKAAARIGQRAEGALGRFGNSIENMNAQLSAFEERFGSGKVSAEAEVAKIGAQFAPMVRQIENMRLAVSHLKGAEGQRTAVLEELSAVEERLNAIRAQGIALAIRKAARERADAIEDAARTVRSSDSQARISELGLQMFGSGEADIISRKEAAQSQVDGITDKIKEMRRRLEDTPGDTWLPQFIDKLEQIRGRFVILRDTVGTTEEALAKIANDLGKSVSTALEDGLGSSIEALITRTKNLGDVVKTMYAEITRAAIQYLMKQALIQAGSSDGTMGTLFSALLGAGGSAATAGASVPVVPSANGNVFSKFASGGSFTNSIVRGPTQFPIGLMGEAGPEAIMPLKNVNGKLGVAASGGGGGDNYNINITAVDAASVARLFSEHGGALVDTMRHRDRLNRGYGKR